MASSLAITFMVVLIQVSIGVVKLYDQTPYKRMFNWAYGFRGLESMMVEQRHGGRNS